MSEDDLGIIMQGFIQDHCRCSTGECPLCAAERDIQNALDAAEHRGLIKGLEMAREIAAARSDGDWDANSVVDDIDSRLFSILERDATLQSEHKEGNGG